MQTEIVQAWVLNRSSRCGMIARTSAHLEEIEGAADIGDDLSQGLGSALLQHDFHDCPHP